MGRRRSMVQAAAAVGAVALTVSACSSSGSSGSGSQAPASPTSDGVLKIGTVLPQTGSLAFLGPPEFAAVNLAVKQINAAGGVNGKDVQVFEGDSGDTSTNIASTTADQMIARGSDVIVGAASSSVTLSIIDKITSSGVLEISPANTSPELSTYQDNGLYWRTAPPDTFQGQVLAETVADNGSKKPAVLVLQDSYGEGLAQYFQTNFESAGGTLAGDPIFYDPKASTFDAEVGQAKALNPDGIVLIGFEESKKIIQELIKQGIGPDKVKLYLVDGDLSQTIADGLPKGIMNGTLGTLPGSQAPAEFRKQLNEVDPKLKDYSYAPEAYDAVMVSALGAIAAKNETGPAIAAQLVDITSGGQACDQFAECKKLLEAGKDIDYQGESGPIEFQSNGDPGQAVMGVYKYGEDNKFVSDRYVEGTVPPPSESSPASS